LDDALIEIRSKYGDGKLSIRECNVQSRKGFTWYEFYIEVPRGEELIIHEFKMA
jgi:hypothetical protein